MKAAVLAFSSVFDVACNPWFLFEVCTYGHSGDDVIDALIDEAID